MAEFVKKTMMGYKDVPGGNSDPECTHVILTRMEYEKQLQEISAAETEAGQNVETLEQKLAEAQEEVEYQRELNANLLRISRERANADRKLKPKKEHTGYIVVSTLEKDYRFKINRHQREQTRLWETTLQSPYSIDFTEEQARKQIREDLFDVNKDSLWLIGSIGIASAYDGRYEDLIELKDWETKYEAENIAIKPELKLRANFRAGYWEASFLHTKPLGVVPPEMRVRQSLAIKCNLVANRGRFMPAEVSKK